MNLLFKNVWFCKTCESLLCVVSLVEELQSRGSGIGGPGLIQSITVMSETEKNFLKQARKEEKKLLKTARQLTDDTEVLDFDPKQLKAKRQVCNTLKIISLYQHVRFLYRLYHYDA